MSDKFNWKDITYFVSFLIALFTFLKTFRKKEYVSIDYKTEYGDEANLYVFAIKGIAYSVQIKNETYDILGKKYENLNISTQKFERNKNTGDESSYFPKLGENEVIEIENAFKKSAFTSKEKYAKFSEGFSLKTLKKDPLFQLVDQMMAKYPSSKKSYLKKLNSMVFSKINSFVQLSKNKNSLSSEFHI